MIDNDEDLVESDSIGAGDREDAPDAPKVPSSILERLFVFLESEAPDVSSLIEGFLRNEVKCAILLPDGESQRSGGTGHDRVRERGREGQGARGVASSEADALGGGRCGAVVVSRATRLAFEAARRASQTRRSSPPRRRR